MKRELEAWQIAERSISKTYRKTIWNPFVEAVKKYQMIQSGDKIAVCISGGKDSMILSVLMRMLQRYSEVPFELEYIVMDPGYNEENRQRIIDNAKILNIPIDIFNSDIFNVVVKIEQNPCYLCARMRRGYLYSRAKELGCNKIALGHHMSDVIETTVMGMFYGSQIQAMLPRLKSTNYEGMELIRPMYCIKEDAIIAWSKYNNLEFIRCACRFTEDYKTNDNKEGLSKRQEIKDLIKQMKKVNPNIEINIFRSIHNANVDTLVEYKLNDEFHSFLEKFE
ncbi:MAG: tRNA 2-thiocytidine biosynthesis protein TtcA [Ruminococcaceae bacterium]|nr:tRNA 2-thiocytidine biosynthesis protein TtcA [Oscillospiraceae bacterium]